MMMHPVVARDYGSCVGSLRGCTAAPDCKPYGGNSYTAHHPMPRRTTYSLTPAKHPVSSPNLNVRLTCGAERGASITTHPQICALHRS